jgi:hypothetical protein
MRGIMYRRLPETLTKTLVLLFSGWLIKPPVDIYTLFNTLQLLCKSAVVTAFCAWDWIEAIDLAHLLFIFIMIIFESAPTPPKT